MPVRNRRYKSNRVCLLPVTMRMLMNLVFKGKDATPLVSFPFTAVLGKKVKGPDDYQEVKDRLVADYQTYLDGRWVDRLRSSAKVEINQEVLKPLIITDATD